MSLAATLTLVCLDGTGEITIDGCKIFNSRRRIHRHAGKHPHAAYGKEQYKMLIGRCILIRTLHPKIDKSQSTPSLFCESLLIGIYFRFVPY